LRSSQYLDTSWCGFGRASSALHSTVCGRTTFSPRQQHALARASIRELRWGLAAVSGEVGRWRARAAAIPDEALRHDALRAIDYKRASIDGAALFWILPGQRNYSLLRVLVAYEILADFLDCVNERAAHVGIENGLRLHRALCDALAPGAPITDYYRNHPHGNDGGFLKLLIVTCQEACVLLPSFDVVRPFVARAASLTDVLALNHEPDPSGRDAALRAWASGRFPAHPELAWFECCASASAWLTILALLALAADVGCETSEAEKVYDAYLPWVSLAGTMLDSYADIVDDEADGAHSYIAHYGDRQVAVNRLIEILGRSLREVAGLKNSQRHLVIVTCMVAMFLSKDSARAPAMRSSTSKITRASGSLTGLLVPVLRAWRAIYGQQST
jgi:tetraprenyl-beta-curcumene synthase